MDLPCVRLVCFCCTLRCRETSNQNKKCGVHAHSAISRLTMNAVHGSFTVYFFTISTLRFQTYLDSPLGLSKSSFTLCTKTKRQLLVMLNEASFVQTFYICFFLFYAPKKTKIESLKLIGLIIVVGFGLIIGLTQFLAHGANRVAIVG